MQKRDESAAVSRCSQASYCFLSSDTVVMVMENKQTNKIYTLSLYYNRSCLLRDEQRFVLFLELFFKEKKMKL